MTTATMKSATPTTDALLAEIQKTRAEIQKALDPRRQTEPGLGDGGGAGG